jgi:hypothetical protein
VCRRRFVMCITKQINQDFTKMYPGKENMLASTWPEMSAKIVPVMCRSKDKEAERLQSIMCHTSNAGFC